MTLFVDLGVERRWPTASGAAFAAVGVLVSLARDGGFDATPAQVGPVGPGGVSLISQHPIRTRTSPPHTQPRYPDPVQDRDELRAVATLPRAQHHRQWLLSLLTAQIQLRGQPATRATQCMIGRLGIESVPRSRHAASGETTRTPPARTRTARARLATVRRRGSATGSRLSTGVYSIAAADPAVCLWAATVPALPTARRSGHAAPSPLRWPRGLRTDGLFRR